MVEWKIYPGGSHFQGPSSIYYNIRSFHLVKVDGIGPWYYRGIFPWYQPMVIVVGFQGK